MRERERERERERGRKGRREGGGLEYRRLYCTSGFKMLNYFRFYSISVLRFSHFLLNWASLSLMK